MGNAMNVVNFPFFVVITNYTYKLDAYSKSCSNYPFFRRHKLRYNYRLIRDEIYKKDQKKIG